MKSTKLGWISNICPLQIKRVTLWAVSGGVCELICALFKIKRELNFLIRLE